MKNRELKKALKEAKPVALLIRSKLERVRRFENVTGINSITSGVLHDLFAQERESLQKEIQELEAYRAAIEQAIRNIPDKTMQMILERRYLDGAPFDQISLELGLSSDSVFRLHRKAVESISESDGEIILKRSSRS